MSPKVQHNSEVTPCTSKLTEIEKLRIERNRQKALSLRQAKLLTKQAGDITESIIKVQGSKFIDSGGGFLIEKFPEAQATSNEADLTEIPEDDAEAVPITYYDCLDCQDKFVDSFLWKNFEYSVCDACRDNDDKHKLITRTEAKNEYLLKDCDFDKREPALKYITRKNPHNSRWGDMKLYLLLQIEERALVVWGSEEQLCQERELREEKREKTKLKKYNKRIEELRMDVRSSIYDRTTSVHAHEFGPEVLIEEDTYNRTCKTCGFVETFEKL